MPRRLDAGAGVAALGALLILVSLFLDWYGTDRQGVSAWTVFEVIDLVLATIALLAISTFLSRSGFERRLPEAPLLLLGGGALVVVFSQLVNKPPAVAGSDAGLETGAWLGLAGAALLLAGALMSVARVSLALSVEHRERMERQPAPRADPDTETVKLTPPEPPV
jgi:hypothetical protein